MTPSEILSQISPLKWFVVATASADGEPHARYVSLMRADSSGIYFATGTHKSFYKQLCQSRRTVLVFMLGPTQLRLRGELEEVPIEDHFHEVIEKYPFLEETWSEETTRVFRMTRGTWHIWNTDIELERGQNETGSFDLADGDSDA